MKCLDDLRTRRLGMRFGANRLCLWCLCRVKACRRARACIGEPRHCSGLIAAWVDAMHEERRLRADVAAIERGLKTMEEVRAFRAWRAALDRAFEHERNDPAVERLREEVARMVKTMCKTMDREREQALRKEREADEANSARPRAGDAPSRLRDGDPAGGDPEVKIDDSEFDPGFPLTRE